MRRQSLIGAALIVLAAFSLSGCQYLFGISSGQGPGPFPSDVPFPVSSDAPFPIPSDGDIPLPSAVATYLTGSATLKLGDQTVKLDRLVGTAGVYADYPEDVGWTDGKGWYLRVSGATTAPDSFGEASLSIDHIVGGQHRSTLESGGCQPKMTVVGPTGLSGTASCKGLRWSDMMIAFGSFDGDPGIIKDEPAFDAELTFQAAP